MEKYFRNFRPCGAILFAQYRGFFEIFKMYLRTTPQKITLYWILINKFPKNFEKSAQKFFAPPPAPKTCRNTPIFSARVWRNNPPFEGSPPQISLVLGPLPSIWRWYYKNRNQLIGGQGLYTLFNKCSAFKIFQGAFRVVN